MKISELMEQLGVVQGTHGDVEIVVWDARGELCKIDCVCKLHPMDGYIIGIRAWHKVDEKSPG